jgi:hypothetical protein
MEEQMPLSPFTIWTDPDRSRHFLLPDRLRLPAGPLTLRAPLGQRRSVDPANVLPYELSAEQARVWVASEITGAMAALPTGSAGGGEAGEKVLAAAQLVRQLPELVRLSANPSTLPQARALGAGLDRLLAGAGIQSHSAFGGLPDRLAAPEAAAAVRATREEIAAELRRAGEMIDDGPVRRFLAALLELTATPC